MNDLLAEVRIMHNPGLGAVLIWQFCCGYSANAPDRRVPLHLAFLVLPVLLNSRTAESIISTRTRSGIRKFEEKFSDEGDLLLGVRARALELRSLTLTSTRLALRARLLALSARSAELMPLSVSKPPTQEGIRALVDAAHRFGVWCGRISIYELATILKVEF